MANIYVRSTDGVDTDAGSTWALAKATATGAAAIDAPGDGIYLSSVHSESTNAAITLALAGTLASPTIVASVNDAAEPPTATSAGAVIATGAGAYGITVTGVVYICGVIFKAGVGASNTIGMSFASVDGNYQKYTDSQFWMSSTGASNGINFGASGSGFEARVDLENCWVKLSGASQSVRPAKCKFRWVGGGVIAGTTTATLVAIGSDQTDIVLDGLDLSSMGATTSIFLTGAAGVGKAVIRNSRLPASWTGALVDTPTAFNVRCEMYNCDNADTNYRLWIVDHAGSIVSETTIVRTGGASDGVTGLAWKMAATSDAHYPLIGIESPEIVRWNDVVASAVTATIEIVHDSQGSGTAGRFTDAEVWLEVQYLGTSGYPLSTLIKDCKADILVAAADQTDSTETWATTGLTTPVKQNLSVTFTPQEKGFIHAKVVLARISKTCYVCPKITVA